MAGRRHGRRSAKKLTCPPAKRAACMLCFFGLSIAALSATLIVDETLQSFLIADKPQSQTESSGVFGALSSGAGTSSANMRLMHGVATLARPSLEDISPMIVRSRSSSTRPLANPGIMIDSTELTNTNSSLSSSSPAPSLSSSSQARSSGSVKKDRESVRTSDVVTSMASSWKCEKLETNRSCVFQNLYWWNNDFHLFLVQGAKTPSQASMRVSLASKHGPITFPNTRFFESERKLAKFVSGDKFKNWDELVLIFDVMWHHNVGHALFDGLYPAFLALRKFGLHQQPFRALAGIAPDMGRQMIEDIIEVFAGLGLRYVYKLQRQKQFVHMQQAVMGSRNMGQRHMNRDLCLHGARDLDAARGFRDRMYFSYKVPLIHDDEMKAIIINNRRFTEKDRSMLKSIDKLDGMIVQFVDWSSMGSFKSQLKVLRTVAVHVSSVGTGQMYQTFLRDGAIHINLGSIESGRQRPFPFFMEQYMAEGAPYLRALYYNSTKRLCGLHIREVRSLMLQAVKLYRKGFDIPVPLGENLSPEGQIFRELCQISDCTDILMSMNPDPSNTKDFQGICFFDGWAEYAVYEQSGWHKSGWTDGGRSQYCPIDREKLRFLKSRMKGSLAPMVRKDRLVCENGDVQRIRSG